MIVSVVDGHERWTQPTDQSFAHPAPSRGRAGFASGPGAPLQDMVLRFTEGLRGLSDVAAVERRVIILALLRRVQIDGGSLRRLNRARR